MVGLFAVYLAMTLDTIRLISETVPQLVGSSYGADVGVDSLQAAANGKTGLIWLSEAGNGPTVAAITAGTGAIAALAWRRRALEEVAVRSDFRLDAFVAGAGIYVFSFVLWHNFDYRLIFLLMALPQLIVWARTSRSLVPVPRLTLGALIGTLWLSEPLTENTGFWNPVIAPVTLDNLGVSLDEILNWILFVSLGVGLLLATVPLVWNRSGIPLLARRRKTARSISREGAAF